MCLSRCDVSRRWRLSLPSPFKPQLDCAIASLGPYACARCADYEDAAVCNGQLDCGGNGPCALGSFCNFDCGDGSDGDPSCGTCETCDDEYFTFMEQSCDARGLPGSGAADCHACCT